LREIYDFFNFDIFISPFILKILYFLGAIFLPALAWLALKKIRRRYPKINAHFSAAESATGTRFHLLMLMAFTFALICTETLWRVIFEYLIAYLQMREAIMELLRSNMPF